MSSAIGRRQAISHFFRDYERKLNDVISPVPGTSLEEAAKIFAPYVVESDDEGCRGVNFGDEFKRVLPKGIRYYRNLGMKAIRIASMVSQPIDEWHSLVKVHWDSDCRTPNGEMEHLDFDVTYILRKDMATSDLKIFCYITADERKALRDKGLLAGHSDAALASSPH